MSKKDDNPGYVKVSVCVATHTELRKQMENMQSDMKKIVNTLMGEETGDGLLRKGGLVNDIQMIKNGMKSRLSGRDKAAIAVAVIMAAASIISRWI